MGNYISFEDVEALATIEQLATMLSLETRRSGRQLRCACPVHGGDDRTLAITPDVRSKRGSVGVFFCQSSKSGGDRIGLVAHCMDMGQQDAAYFIAEQFGMENSNSEGTVTSTVSNSRATVPPEQKREPTRQFDPEAYAAKLAYNETVAALGITEADAASLGIGYMASGMHKGEVAFALRWPTGEIAGFGSVKDGKLKLPQKLIPPRGNVVPLKRPA